MLATRRSAAPSSHAHTILFARPHSAHGTTSVVDVPLEASSFVPRRLHRPGFPGRNDGILEVPLARAVLALLLQRVLAQLRTQLHDRVRHEPRHRPLLFERQSLERIQHRRPQIRRYLPRILIDHKRLPRLFHVEHCTPRCRTLQPPAMHWDMSQRCSRPRTPHIRPTRPLNSFANRPRAPAEPAPGSPETLHARIEASTTRPPALDHLERDRRRLRYALHVATAHPQCPCSHTSRGIRPGFAPPRRSSSREATSHACPRAETRSPPVAR